MVTEERAAPDDANPDLTCHELVRERIRAWMAERPQDHAGLTENAIRLAILRPKDEAAITGAHEDPERLDGLSADDFVNIPGCDVFWVREVDHFRGYMKPGACTIKSRRDGRVIVIDEGRIVEMTEVLTG